MDPNHPDAQEIIALFRLPNNRVHVLLHQGVSEEGLVEAQEVLPV
jgi:hypothetical protein